MARLIATTGDPVISKRRSYRRSIAGQSVYLVRGELALAYRQGMPEVIVGGSAEARCPLGKRRVFISAKAVTGVELIRIDDDLLDVMQLEGRALRSGLTVPGRRHQAAGPVQQLHAIIAELTALALRMQP